MRRFILIIIILLSLPLITYIYRNLKSKNKDKLARVPVLHLFGISFLLILLIFGIFTMWNRAGTNVKYIPPKYENGKLIDARFK